MNISFAARSDGGVDVFRNGEYMGYRLTWARALFEFVPHEGVGKVWVYIPHACRQP